MLNEKTAQLLLDTIYYIIDVKSSLVNLCACFFRF